MSARLLDRNDFDWKSLALVVGGHLAVLGAAVITASTLEVEVTDARPIMASLISTAAPTPILQPQPTPPAAPRRPELPRRLLAAPTPTASPVVAAPLPPPEAVRPAPSPMPAAASPPAASPMASQVPSESAEPRFDADYLNNPKPGYPALSRRLGEEGQVLLRVLVAEDGSPREIKLLKSSGYDRLDAAAQEAVSHWRFVPARKGNVPVAASVQVPVSFQLRR